MNDDASKKEERKFQLEQMKIQLLHDAFNSIMTALITVSTSASIALIAIVFTVDLQESVKTILALFSVLMGIVFLVVGVSFVLITFIYFPRRIDKLKREYEKP